MESALVVSNQSGYYSNKHPRSSAARVLAVILSYRVHSFNLPHPLFSATSHLP